jgi:hypothetical protein
MACSGSARHFFRFSNCYGFIEARYGSQADYVAAVTEEAAKLRAQGFMLEEDELATVAQAEKMVWPPVPTNRYPFWQMTP